MMPENVYNTTIMFWLQNSLIFLLRWKRSLSFSHFVDHNEILMFAKFYRSDCILEYLNFQNFLGKHAPGPPSFLCLRHSLLALSCRYYTYSQLCPSKEKFPASPLLFWLLFHPARKECLRPQGEKQFPWCQYFSFNHDSASYWHYHADITHIPSYAPARKNSRRHPCFFGSCFTRREKSACDHKVRNNFLGVNIFRSIMIQPLIFLSS